MTVIEKLFKIKGFFKMQDVDILPHLNDETVATYAGRKGLPQDQGC
jgi:hypothetical protein